MKPYRITFGPYAPDLKDSAQGHCTYVRNAIPTINGWEHYNGSFSGHNSGQGSAAIIGAIGVTATDGTQHNYAGAAAKLWMSDSSTSTHTWTDKSGAVYTTASGENWRFAEFNGKVLAVNWSDNPQQHTIGAAGNFSDLTTALKARHIAVVRDFVVMANTSDSTDGNKPNRVRWSAYADETDYTVSPVTQSGLYDLPGNPGAVVALIGGEDGYVLCERAVFRMVYVGAPQVFRFDEILPRRGCLVGNSALKIGNDVYYLSTDGFVKIGASGMQYYGAEVVDETILRNTVFGVKLSEKHQARAVADPERPLIWFAYVPAQVSTPTNVLWYNWKINKFGFSDSGLTTLTSLFVAQTVNGPTIGFFPVGDGQLSVRTGTTIREVKLRAAEVEISDGNRTFVGRARPNSEGNSAESNTKILVYTRNTKNDDKTVATTYTAMSLSGANEEMPMRKEARYFTFELQYTGTDTRTYITGLDILEYRTSGRR